MGYKSIIAFFNNKGGVSKTTTCFNLGWKLSSLGYTVVLVDADPQCNLSGLALDVEDNGTHNQAYQNYAQSNLYDSLLPALKSTGSKLRAPELQRVASNPKLLLLPGSIKLAEVETQLATALNMGSMLPAMQNVPGSFGALYELIFEKYDADFILIDMSPSLGALNQVNFLNSDYFIVPMFPDIFSVMALESLSEAIPGWVNWSQKIQALQMFSDSDLVYKFEPRTPKYLGSVIQRYRPRNGVPTQMFEQYFNMLLDTTENTFIPRMRECGLTLDPAIQAEYVSDYRLAEIPDFNSLIASSQQAHKPVFELKESDLTTSGAAASSQLNNIHNFDRIFTDFANTVVGIVKEASANY
ncbi:ParA family protein [Trueperella pecoris]|uniref:ParA family protein n=1 Tax=Trueperella pecoris TaxID=2733571 RepID=UPI00186BA152|nr:AAA family ATPase [Trueperella pecoris]QOQ39414.1 ParA family protein [Trueperella pecoris]